MVLMSLTHSQDLQKRFLELQALLGRYQANGKTPSPQKPLKSATNEEKENHQVCEVSLALFEQNFAPCCNIILSLLQVLNFSP